MKYLLILMCVIRLIFADPGLNWALLVAGTNSYLNYRNQADVCHAYQVLHKHGIPDERIVVMMYDDIAYNPLNPVKGNIINRPSGPNVYKGTVKDYTNETITSKNFLDVLQGKSEAMLGIGSGKVINSGPDDNIFVYISALGAPGAITFPDGSILHAQELNNVIKDMYDNKRYGKMVIYLEACESGSMFDSLLEDGINVYATTSANPYEASWACYPDNFRQVFLGDLYSVNWLQDSDSKNISNETLSEQFKNVKKHTKKSHVKQYGNLTMSEIFQVSDFLGENSSLQNNMNKLLTGSRSNQNFKIAKAENVRLASLKEMLSREKDLKKKKELRSKVIALMKYKKKTGELFQEIVSVIVNRNADYMNKIMKSRRKLTNHSCYVPVIDHLLTKCVSAKHFKNEYALRNFYKMVNLCEDGFGSGEIKRVIDQVCVNRLEDFTNDF